MSQQILHIAVPTPLRKTFDYLPAEDETTCALQPGMRVLIPWANKTLIGIIDHIDNTHHFPLDRLKKIIKVLDPEPMLDTELMALGHWASDYYHHPLGDVFSQMLPLYLRREKSLVMDEDFVWQINQQQTLPNLGRSKTQLACYQYLQQNPKGCSQQQLIHQGFKQTVINNLLEKNLITKVQQHPSYSHQVKIPGPPLNQEQAQAVNSICKALGHFKTLVLDGVTGSGKTEVYLQAIADVLQRGQQALVLVPEIGLTPQTLSRFQQRFDTEVVVMHSALSDKQRCLNWQKARGGEAKLIIGTRSAIFTAFHQLGLIIIDESHDASFKQQDSFRYSARDLGIMRAKQLNIPILLGSATPSFEVLNNLTRGRFHHLRLTQRAGQAKAPTYELMDIRQQQLYAGLCARAIEAIKQEVQEGNQILLFLNRRGYAPTLMCHDCGWLAECRHCDARLTLHLSPKHLHCHHCDYAQKNITLCPKCHSGNVMPIGLGTERLEQHLAELFPEQGICRIDRDSTRKKGALNQLLDAIHSGKHQILLGTQMLAKGHHFPQVTLVVVINGDSGFFSADFRGSERMAQLLVQVAGRAGRAEKPGHVIIQTRNPEHPNLQLLLTQGYHGFAKQIMNERQLAHLPPFSYQALMRADSKKPEQAEAFLADIKQRLPQEKITILGPIAAPMSKRAGRYRSQLLLQSPQRSLLQQFLRRMIQEVEQLKISSSMRWSIDVDPIDTY